MKVTIQRHVEYTPTWGGNDELPAAERCVVLIRVPTTEERSRYCGTDVSATMSGASYTPKIDIRTNQVELVRRHVTEVRGLTLEEDGRDQDIRNGTEMTAAVGLHELVQEIGNHISQLTAEVAGVDPRLVSPSAPGSGATSGAAKQPARG